MQPQLIRAQGQQEFFIDEQCYITEFSNGDHDPELSIARARVEPGVTTRWHRLQGTMERYLILSGTGLVEVGELPAQQVGPGDVVLIPAQCRQRISNTGQEDLLFLALCTPRFLPENYEELEPERG